MAVSIPDIKAAPINATKNPKPMHTGPNDTPQNAENIGAINVLNKAITPDDSENNIDFRLNVFFNQTTFLSIQVYSY